MSIQHRDAREFHYTSERHLTRKPVRLRASYRGLGRMNTLDQSRPGTIEHFLTERYALYTTGSGGKLHRGNIHHLPWPLELAEAEFELNELPTRPRHPTPRHQASPPLRQRISRLRLVPRTRPIPPQTPSRSRRTRTAVSRSSSNPTGKCLVIPRATPHHSTRTPRPGPRCARVPKNPL